MAGKRIDNNSNSNPFYYDSKNEDVDDESFVSHPRQGTSGYILTGQSGGNDNKTSQRQQQMVEEIRQIQERSLRSTQRSLGLVYESEEMGVATAVELVQQREQLQNTEEKLDTINQTLRHTQKNINSMKSLFGGIKGYFSKSSEQQKQVNLSSGPGPTPSKLKNVIDSSKSEDVIGSRRTTNNHPAIRARGLDTSGFFAEEDEDLDQAFVGRTAPRQAQSVPTFKDVETDLDRNLGDLSLGLGRLKNLAVGLGQEIDEQNELLDRISTKTDKADISVSRQNKQMNQILK